MLFNYFGRASGNKEKISLVLFAFLGKGTRYPYLRQRETMHTPNTKQAPNTKVGHLAPEAMTRLRHKFSLTTSVLCPGPRRVTVTFQQRLMHQYKIHHSVACSKHKNVNHSQSGEQAYFWLIFLPITSCF